MPQNPEHREKQAPEPGGRKPEGQPLPYYLAATFKTREDAEQPYQRAQEIIFDPAHDADLSAFRFERKPHDPKQPPLSRPWFVVVIGETPEGAIHQQLQEVLGAGEFTRLSLEAILTLAKRRKSETRKGDRVEGHYEPGRILPEVTITMQRRNPKKDKLKQNQQKQSRRKNRGK